MTTDEGSTEPAFKTRAFLWGADMNPTTIRRRWPEGRFVTIARAAGLLTRGAGLPAGAFGPEVWGIIVETGAAQAGTPVPLALPDGSEATAMLMAEPEAIGSAIDILTEANYWELPQAYRDRILGYIDASATA